VTKTDAKIRGSMPNSAGLLVGYQLLPISAAVNLYWEKKGRDSLSRVRIIPMIKTSDAKASMAKIHRYSFSLNLCIATFFAPHKQGPTNPVSALSNPG
jgi:hypothetical protein